MGGIKNKLSKLSNKVKTLFNSLPLAGRADEMTKSSQSREGNNNKTIPLSDYRLTSPFSQRGTKNAVNKGSLSLKGAGSPLGLTEGSLSAGLSSTILTKYLGIACLSFAILSTLVLNIVSSYSYSNIESNAEPVSNSSTSTLANNNDSSTCNPNNTNAESCISLAITSSSSSSTGGNDPNLSLSIPQGGGIATGSHTVTVVTNNVTGWGLVLSASNSSLVNTINKSFSINSLPSSATIGSATTLANNTWGVALPYGAWSESGYYNQPEDYVSTNDTVLSRTRWTSIDYLSISHEQIAYHNTPTDGIVSYSRRNIYYGVRVDNPNELLAGNYQAEVVYTATTNKVPIPTMTSIDPNQYELDSGASGQITINGTNILSAYSVYITNTNGDRVGECANLNVTDDSNVSCTVPTTGIAAGDYTIHVVTQGGEGSIGFTYTEAAKKLSVYDSTANVRVDYDANMIPVKYIGYDGNGGHWAVVTNAEIDQNVNNWFEYDSTEKRWANAITVTAESRDKYKKKQTGEDPDPSIVSNNNPEILGYWVYIPRYAYEVQRRDAYDPVSNASANTSVFAQNFDIVFETKDTPKKTPAECLNGDYQTCIKNQYGGSAINYPNTTSQDDPLNNQTAWATHPAFTWGDKELNGFWIGKFETTGTRTAPTVKPNQHANISEYVGEFYSAAKSIGQPDPNNQYGGANSDDTTSGLTQNSHHLAVSTSHMLKNSEWGAVAYLSASKYGAGVNNVQINGAYLARGSTDADGTSSRYGVTGCGPEADGVEDRYNAGTLNKSTTESSTACGNADRAYNGSIGVLASTTNNVYGVYDMSGGVWEYVMGNYSTNLSQTSNSTIIMDGEVKTPIKPPYVDIYNITSNNSCTWDTDGSGCGGHALFETDSWGGDIAGFVDSSYPWFTRSVYAFARSQTGVFASGDYNGSDYTTVGFRVALLAE